MGGVAQRNAVQEILEAPRREHAEHGAGEATGGPIEDVSMLKVFSDLERAGHGQGPRDPAHPLSVHRTSSDGSASDTSLPPRAGTMRVPSTTIFYRRSAADEDNFQRRPGFREMK
jgi:hypothetical protein